MLFTPSFVKFGQLQISADMNNREIDHRKCFLLFVFRKASMLQWKYWNGWRVESLLYCFIYCFLRFEWTEHGCRIWL